MTKTSAFGTPRREGHDSSDFYARNLYSVNGSTVQAETGKEQSAQSDVSEEGTPTQAAQLGRSCFDNGLAEQAPRNIPSKPLSEWANRIYCQTAEKMDHVPDESVGIAFTSPPYNVGKEYDDDISFDEYLSMMRNVGQEVYRVLKPGGRYVVNIANLGRKPYIPLHAHYYDLHEKLGFLPMGEVIWQKGQGANSSCAWGSWMSAKAPRLRDLHEYLLVFAKDEFARPDRGTSDIERDEFMRATLSVWQISPESAKRVGHPAPFPLELADRVIRLYSYTDEPVLDPFCGSGTTCVAAKQSGRPYVGYDISEEYCELARKRLQENA
ncbi:site-specific DNA-methyltransferase [Chloroflexi bacterium TSY]|nr:site-specific DNA-methyltransferase [Chloroflexi bacterium TSY]